MCVCGGSIPCLIDRVLMVSGRPSAGAGQHRSGQRGRPAGARRDAARLGDAAVPRGAGRPAGRVQPSGRRAQQHRHAGQEPAGAHGPGPAPTAVRTTRRAGPRGAAAQRGHRSVSQSLPQLAAHRRLHPVLMSLPVIRGAGVAGSAGCHPA